MRLETREASALASDFGLGDPTAVSTGLDTEPASAAPCGVTPTAVASRARALRRIRFRRFLFCVRRLPAPGGMEREGGGSVFPASLKSSESDSLEDELDEEEVDFELEEADDEEDDDVEDDEDDDDADGEDLADSDACGTDKLGTPLHALAKTFACPTTEADEPLRDRFKGRPGPSAGVDAAPLTIGRFEDKTGGGSLELDRPGWRDEDGEEGRATKAADLAATGAEVPA